MPRKRRNHPYDDLPGLFDEFEDNRRGAAPSRPAAAGVQANTPLIGGREGAAPLLSPIDFISFGSGSSGNCAYIGDRDGGFLIDAGIEPNNVFTALARNGIQPEMVHGIILTHDHGDHIRYVYSTVRRYRHLLVYCTPKTLGGIMRRHNISRRLTDYHKPVYKEFEFRIGNFSITPFDVSHDGTDNVGYFIRSGHHTFTIATDLGCITERVDHYMRLARYIMVEANYDEEMLRRGSYPEYLKARIVADNGHLDNRVTADFLAGIYTDGLRAVFLCHLSHDNNTPELATETVRRALLAAHPSLTIGDGTHSLASRDAALQLLPLPRFTPTPLFRFH